MLRVCLDNIVVVRGPSVLMLLVSVLSCMCCCFDGHWHLILLVLASVLMVKLVPAVHFNGKIQLIVVIDASLGLFLLVDHHGKDPAGVRDVEEALGTPGSLMLWMLSCRCPMHQGANSCMCAQDFCACAHCPKTQESFT